MKDEQYLLKHQIGGQMNLEFDEFAIHGKLIKRGIPISSYLELDSKKYTKFKMSDFSDKNLGKMKDTMN